MTITEIKAIQTKIGAKPDGRWGKESVKKCKEYLIRLAGTRNRFPNDTQSSLEAYYGTWGDAGYEERGTLTVAGLGIEYMGKPVTKITCHRKVQESLYFILKEISESDHAWILKHYAGCYQARAQRNGNKPSRHGWAIAIDLNPPNNGNLTKWPEVATMPFGIIEIFAKHGWMSAAVWWGRDAMHFQATKLTL